MEFFVLHYNCIVNIILDFLGEWDVGISALFALLYLIPPAPQGQGKGSRSKTDDAKERLVTFYKVIMIIHIFTI